MTLEDIRKLRTLQTKAIAAACKDENTLAYVIQCLHRFYTGDYGEICAEDTAANNMEMLEGFGHILARYKGAGQLTGDIYIESHFALAWIYRT